MPETKIEEVIAKAKEYNQITRKNSQVMPKIGTIRKTGNYPIKNFNFKVGDTFTYKGKAYSPIPECLARRTVFIEKPVIINGEKYYLELKGYGANGKHIFPREHEEHDIFYGMYYKNAEKEFDLLQVAYKIGTNSPLAVALVEANQDDLVKQLFLGLKELLEAYLKFKSIDYTIWKEFLKKNGYKGNIEPGDTYEPKDSQLNKAIKVLNEIYYLGGPDKLHKVLNHLVSKDPTAKWRPVNFVRFDAKAGYVVRACKSPLRVGDPNDKNLPKEKYAAIGRNIGCDFRLLLEHGYLHSSPNIGNWTLASELTDFEDVINLHDGQSELLEVMNNFSTKTLEKYVEFILGFPHCGILSEFFCEGIMGGETTFKKACDGVLSILREFV